MRLRSESSRLEKAAKGETVNQGENSEPDQILDSVLAQIDPVSLSEHVGKPIEAARISYALDTVVVDSAEDFYDIVYSYYFHLCRRLGEISSDTASDALNDEAHVLLERAFFGKAALRPH